MKAKKTDTKPLSKTQWDFTGVRQSELPSCWLYEYLRELYREAPPAKAGKWIVFIMRKWEEEPEQKGDDEKKRGRPRVNDHPPSKKPFKEWRECTLPHVAGWPKTPWQELEDKDRKAVIDALEAQRNKRPPAMRVWSAKELSRLVDGNPGLEGLHPGVISNYYFRKFYGGENERSMSAHSEHGLWMIDFDRSRAEIEADFTRWLDTVLPKPANRDVLRAELKQLGALRLLRHTKGDWKEAAQLSANENERAKALYDNLPAWIRARDAAKEILNREFTR